MQKISGDNLVIIADDLTGAMDASGYLAGKGIPVRVFPVPVFKLATGLTVVNTDSRSDQPAAAGEKLQELAKSLKDEKLFKKIDSTLRGNIEVEIGAMLEVLPFDKAVICPAFPAAGRTIENGILKVNGVPVADTDFGCDPVNPVRESFIPALFERERLHTGLVALADVAKGPEHLSEVFAVRREKILVCDAVDETHLRDIAQALAASGSRILPVGSGGLAREMGALLEIPTGNRIKPPTGKGPALLVVGSRHQVSALQLLEAQKAFGLPLLKIDAAAINESSSKRREIERLTREAGSAFASGKSAAITAAFSTLSAGRARDVAAVLAAVARILLNTHSIAGLFLSGGDTAMAVCRELGVIAIRVYGEIRPGIPAGEIDLGERKIRLVTKAGGFGGEMAIVESILYLEKGVL